jgi:hypothetical protein
MPQAGTAARTGKPVHGGTGAQGHGRDKGKRGHDVVVPLPKAAGLAVLAVLEGSGDTRRPRDRRPYQR